MFRCFVICFITETRKFKMTNRLHPKEDQKMYYFMLWSIWKYSQEIIATVEMMIGMIS